MTTKPQDQSAARSATSIHALRKPAGAGGSDPAHAVPRPKRRWLTRFVLPVALVACAVALLLYAARDALVPAVEVETVPVIAKAAEAELESAGSPGSESTPQREPTVIAQAPGWIEPDPFPITVQPLASGVVQEILVLEGERVERGQVIARLIAEDAELALRRARAELGELEAAAEHARAQVAIAEARLDELRDEIERNRELVEFGGISRGEFVRLEHRARAQEGELNAARAALQRQLAAIERQQVAVDEAELLLERMTIRAPVSGVVLSRSVVPGTRVAMVGDGMGEAHYPGVVRLYDPAKLQVRADVPLTDAARVGIGTKAQITTDALPDRVFAGEVTRYVHQADIQRNTVQVKVRIDEPSPHLKPDMLTRVRFLSEGDVRIAHNGQADSLSDGDSSSLRIFVPAAAVQGRDGERGQVWVAEPAASGRGRHASLREVALGRAEDDMIHVRSGLRPGDRVILNPPAELQPGGRVTVRRAALAAEGGR